MERANSLPKADFIESIQAIYERGLTVDAFLEAEKFAPLKNWQGVNGCILASRIAANLGAPRLAVRLAIRGWRADKSHAGSQFQYAFHLSDLRGTLAGWKYLSEAKPRPDSASEDLADLLALQARMASDLRDFALAEKFMARAEALGGQKPWVRLQRSQLLERQERVEEALEISRLAGALHPQPFHRPAVQTSAHLLQLLDRDEEAIELLRAADRSLQSGPVAGQLFGLLHENGQWAEANAALDRYVELTPLLEPDLQKWVVSQRARVAYHLGKRVEAIRFAGEIDDNFHKDFVKKLELPAPENERVQLEISFVRQHFKTCAPATLAALGRYWQMPAEHLKLAEAMCYDGTPAWQQRDWAENNGWFVREFRATYETIVELLTRKIPFALSTVDATSAHMQAVVGFDRTRNTLLLRDPSQPYIVEVLAPDFLKRYRPFGPRAMLFIPEAESTRLDGIELPDAGLYDDYHRFNLFLSKHQRAEAAEILQAMSEKFGDHELVWETRLHLASYDANLSEQIRCLDRLLELFPDSSAHLLRRFGCMRNAPRGERLEFLRRACGRKNIDPVFNIELARVLSSDARCRSEADFYLKRAARFRPIDSNLINVRADLLWENDELEKATELYRFAANLEGYREHLYEAWFQACRRTGKTHEATLFLRDRFERFGKSSDQPALTLAWAWRELEQPEQAYDVLFEASRLRAENGYLLLRAASVAARLRETEATEKNLAAAKEKVRKNDWLRTSAEIAEFQLDTKTSLHAAREILETEPLSLDAHGAVARALSQSEGNAAALAHLSEAARRFPHHYGLQRMLVDWSRNNDLPTAEAAVRTLLQIDPADAWALRELALILIKTSRGEAALKAATEATQIEPHNSYCFSVRGHVHQQLNQLTEARADFRHAAELSVDNSYALDNLLELARTDSERKTELTFIESQLIRQVVTGDGLLAFLNLARPVLEPETLLKSLQHAHQVRPDLWHAWSALGSQLVHLDRLDEALTIAKKASERFAHLPRIWLDLAKVHQQRKEIDAEISHLRHTFEMSPGWNRATLALTDALERKGDLDGSQKVFERALQHSPNDAQLQASYAHLLWRQRQHPAAFAAAEHALRISPGYQWSWDLLQAWSAEQGDPQRAVNFARELSLEHAGQPRVWLMLARILKEPGEADERIAAADQALKLDSRSVEAWDLKAELLTIDERFDEAAQATVDGIQNCTGETYILQGRRAWIEARRRRFSEAIRLMREVLAENASYVWGWNQLAHWLMEQNLVNDAASALEQLRRLRPHNSWVNRQLGFLQLKQENRAAAQKSFAATLQIDPADSSAAHNLFDLQLKASDLNGATQTLATMKLHQPGAATQAAEIILLLRKNESQAAREILEILCASPDPDPWPLDAAAGAFKRAGRSAEALKIFKRFLKSGSGNPEIGSAAIGLLAAQKKIISAVRLFLSFKPGERQRRAAPPLVSAIAENKSKLSLRWLLWRRRDVLHLDDEAWGKVGYALSNFNWMKQVVGWLDDWRHRKNIQPWMLFNLCLALRQLGRYAEADEVARYTLERWGHREGSADLRLFLAVETALAGNVADAQAQLQNVSIRKNVAYDQDLLALAQALVEFLQVPEADRRKQFFAVRLELAKRFSTRRMLKVMKDVRRTFRRTGKVIAQNGGSFSAKFWFGWKLNWQWLLLPLLPVALALAIQPPILLGLLIWYFVRRRK